MPRTKQKIIIAVIILLFLGACVPSPGHVALTNYLDKGIGKLTYEDVVKRWRSPDTLEEGEDTFTAVWIREDYSHPGSIGPPYQPPTVYGEKKTLVFDKKTRRLKSYHVKYY